jgi:hypothetical protein
MRDVQGDEEEREAVVIAVFLQRKETTKRY